MRKLTLVVAMLMMVLMIAAAPALTQEKGKRKAVRRTRLRPRLVAPRGCLDLGLGRWRVHVGSSALVGRRSFGRQHQNVLLRAIS